MPDIDPGELNKRVTIRMNQAIDAGLGPEPNFVEVGQTWAKIEPLQGKEQMIAQQLNPINSHRITIRFRKGLKPVQFDLVYQCREFGITAVVDMYERHEWMVLTCAERP